MSDSIVSVIRTAVPAAVGTVLAYLASKGLELDESTSEALYAGLVGLCTAVYYTVVRFLGTHWPILEYLLGSKKTPKY